MACREGKIGAGKDRRENWNGSKWIRPEKRLAIYIRDSFICCYCSRNLKGANPQEISLDHIVAVNLGGTNEADNLLTCCRNCNNRKQDQRIDEWLEGNAGAILLSFLRAAQPLNVALAKSLIASKEDQ